MASVTVPDFNGVRAALAQVLRTYGHDRLELEFRLGHRTGGRFLPGVSEAGWQKLKTQLDAGKLGPGVVVTDTCELICDDGSGGKYVVDKTGSRPSYWMHKKRLHDFDVDTDTPWCCRVSMSLEVVDDSSRRPPDTHKFERQKQRWSYPWKCWSVDLTRVVSNLPHQLDNDAVSYEVEIELRDPAQLFTRTMDEVVTWGWQLVQDVCGML